MTTVAKMMHWSWWQLWLRWEPGHYDKHGLDGALSLWQLWLSWGPGHGDNHGSGGDLVTVTTVVEIGFCLLQQLRFRWNNGLCDSLSLGDSSHCDNHGRDGTLAFRWFTIASQLQFPSVPTWLSVLWDSTNEDVHFCLIRLPNQH